MKFKRYIKETDMSRREKFSSLLQSKKNRMDMKNKERDQAEREKRDKENERREKIYQHMVEQINKLNPRIKEMGDTIKEMTSALEYGSDDNYIFIDSDRYICHCKRFGKYKGKYPICIPFLNDKYLFYVTDNGYWAVYENDDKPSWPFCDDYAFTDIMKRSMMRVNDIMSQRIDLIANNFDKIENAFYDYVEEKLNED